MRPRCASRLDAVVGRVLAEAELLYQILKEGGVPLLTIELAGVDLGDVREEIGFELAILPDEIPKGVQQLSIADPSQAGEGEYMGFPSVDEG